MCSHRDRSRALHSLGTMELPSYQFLHVDPVDVSARIRNLSVEEIGLGGSMADATMYDAGHSLHWNF